MDILDIKANIRKTTGKGSARVLRREGWIPASAGFVHQDQEILLSPVKETTPISGRSAVSTSLAFGGNNAALAFGRLP